jgi:hypothetical protein
VAVTGVQLLTLCGLAVLGWYAQRVLRDFGDRVIRLRSHSGKVLAEFDRTDDSLLFWCLGAIQLTLIAFVAFVFIKLALNS